jgi:ABC-2 type transport system permease protein
MFLVLLAKELREQWRTSRFITLVAVLSISGLISPILAKYTPVIIRSIPEASAFAGMIPDPTIKDAVDQFVKNVSQFGLVLTVILTMGVMAQEKERGTAAMLLTKPVRRSALVIAKWAAMMATILIGLLFSGLACWFYTLVLFEAIPVGSFLALNLRMALFLSVYMSVALLASTLARTQSTAAGGAFAGLAILLILSAIPRVSEYMPSQILAWGTATFLGHDQTAWPATALSITIILLSLIVACLRFEREEI